MHMAFAVLVIDCTDSVLIKLELSKLRQTYAFPDVHKLQKNAAVVVPMLQCCSCNQRCQTYTLMPGIKSAHMP